MNESVSIQCPHCGETFDIVLDVSESAFGSATADRGSAEFIVDCEVCCRPMTVTMRVRAGEIEELQIVAC